jgi:two-component system, LuxR family, response regulator TtrR
MGDSSQANVIVYDSQPETSNFWQELASVYGLSVRIYPVLDKLPALPEETQILVIDRSVASSGFSTVLSTVCANNPCRQVVATGAAFSIDDAVDLMRNGVAYVLIKPFNRPRMLTVISDLLERARSIACQKEAYFELCGLFATLSTREKDVLEHILIGRSNKDTASLLNVSVRTIESRRAKVYRKLEANCLAELVRKVDRLEQLKDRFMRGRASSTSEPTDGQLSLTGPHSFCSAQTSKSGVLTDPS